MTQLLPLAPKLERMLQDSFNDNKELYMALKHDDARKVNILALDTGITTGFAVLDETGKIRETGNWKYTDNPEAEQYDGVDIKSGDVDELLLMEQLHLIINKYIGDERDVVIIEFALTPTNSALDNRLRFINQTIQTVFSTAKIKIVTVLPSTWKNHRVAQNPIFPKELGKLTQHQKDSIMIARYALQTFVNW